MERNKFGFFVWHDLMATDPQRSLPFFQKLLGWEAKTLDMCEMGPYTLFSAGGQEIGGMVYFDPQHGFPAHWIAYVAVPDLDLVLAKTVGLGGKVCFPATPIPDVGRFAVIEDPQGGYLSLFQYDRPEMALGQVPEGPGTFCWNELHTTDPQAALAFYGPLFGWEAVPQDCSGGEPYILLKNQFGYPGGVMQLTPEAGPRPFWLSYIHVEKLEVQVTMARELGGRIVKEITEIPGHGRFACVLDPTGAGFALFDAP